MSSTALAKARETARRTRMRATHEIAKREHTLVSTTMAAALGLAEAKGHHLPSVVGVDGTIVFGTLALVLGDNVGGGTGRMLQSCADGLLAIGAYKLGRAVGGQAITGVTDPSAMDALLSAS
jgi:hypothetical protein